MALSGRVLITRLGHTRGGGVLVNLSYESKNVAVDAGVGYDGMFETDVYGRPRVRKYGVDIGCY